MGANAQTSVPAFTAGQVLTAQQQTEINTGIPVFATTTTRDAAFGGTGEKTLAEGQFAYIEASNTTQYYDGAAWQPLGGGLVVVKAETAFSAASSFSATNVFSASYRNYLMALNIVSSAASATANFQLSVGGVAAATNYNIQRLEASSTTVSASRASSQTSFAPEVADNTRLMLFWIGNPAVAEQSTFMTQGSLNATAVRLWYASGNHTTATAYDGFVITASTGTFTGSYTIYGLGIA